MYVWFVLAAASLYLIAVGVMLKPTSVVGLIPPAIALGGAMIIRWWVEKQAVRSMFDRASQSWTFLFGNGVVLPIAILMIGFARSEVKPDGFWLEWNWVLVSAGAGLLSGVIFRFVDQPRYARYSALSNLSSPTKVWHDFVTYPVLFGSTVWAGFPLLLPEYHFWPTIIALIAIVSWIGLGVCDVIRDLDPRGQHPGWDRKEFSII
jgi:xanthosine utilization system XapX-like protein